MKFRYRRLSNLKLNYSRLANSFEFLLNADKETQNNLHVHCKTINFLAQTENKKECQSKNALKNCFVSTYYTRYKFISIIHFFVNFSYEAQSLKEFRFVRVQIWIEQILTRGAFIVFLSQLTDATKQPTYEEDEWWENDKDGRVFSAVKPISLGWLIERIQRFGEK